MLKTLRMGDKVITQTCFGNECVLLSNTLNQIIFILYIYSYEQNLFFPLRQG